VPSAREREHPGVPVPGHPRRARVRGRVRVCALRGPDHARHPSARAEPAAQPCPETGHPAVPDHATVTRLNWKRIHRVNRPITHARLRPCAPASDRPCASSPITRPASDHAPRSRAPPPIVRPASDHAPRLRSCAPPPITRPASDRAPPVRSRVRLPGYSPAPRPLPGPPAGWPGWPGVRKPDTATGLAGCPETGHRDGVAGAGGRVSGNRTLPPS